MALAEGGHKLLELGRSLDLEEDLVVVVRHLDVEVLVAAGRGIGALSRGASAVVFTGHLKRGICVGVAGNVRRLLCRSCSLDEKLDLMQNQDRQAVEIA